MDKKRKSLNNQQLTNAIVDHEIRISKLETKKKKIIKKCGKTPKPTIADVMQLLVNFQNSVDERFDKIENEIKDLNKRVDVLSDKVDALENQVNDLNKRLVLVENEVFKAYQ